MIGILACLLAFATAWWFSRRSLGHGVSVVCAWGYVFGILRANFLDGASHFAFDAAVIGLYVGLFAQKRRARSEGRERGIRPWIAALVVWPCLIFLIPFQHPLVQLVGLRAAIFFVPMLLLGAQATEQDLRRIGVALAGLNLLALCFGAAEWVLGVPRFFPYNAVTEIIYLSKDVAGGGMRIPATFSSAHAYGGTMVAGLPFIVLAWQLARSPREQMLCLAGSFAAALGVFLCAARQPAIYLFVLGAYAVTVSPLPPARKFLLGGIALVVAALVSGSERLQRFTTLSDTEKVVSRVQGSVNLHFIELVLEHPMGEGLASAAGTSIPFFLADVAKPQIGMENEWGRIALEQSLVGLGLWLAFIGMTVLRYPRGRDPHERAKRLIWLYVSLAWGTAFIGTGMLTSIPQTALILLGMGTLWRASRDTRPAMRRPPARQRTNVPASRASARLTNLA